jgi:hypothetical protein
MIYTHRVTWTRHWIEGSLEGCRATDSVRFECGEQAADYADYLRGITHLTYCGRWVAEDVEIHQLMENA